MIRKLARLAPLSIVFSAAAFAQWDDNLLRPFAMDHRAAASSPADVSFLLDAPAGKDGFIRIRNGHFARPDGRRIRFWGVHFTDWSPGSVEIPPKEDMPMWAATLARFGVNLVRLHFLDLASPRGIVDSTRGDSRAFDPQQLDRLDFEIAELKKRGIYVDLNLNVGRSYKAGDGVRDYDKIQWGKGLTLYDPRLIELEKEYAHNLLTHVNPYTKNAYRDEPAIALVEIVNENGLYLGFHAPTPYYDEELTALYNAWLEKNRTPEQLQELRKLANVPQGSAIPRLTGREAAAAPKERYNAEMAFFMDTESKFYRDMSGYLKNDLGVKVAIAGSSDHDHSSSPYPMLASLSKLDILDGHVYWEASFSPPPWNTPMVNDPLHSTVVQLSRTAFAGKPYTVSETNHPFPNDYASEGIPIIAAYGSLQDWDAVVMYTFEPKRSPDWKPYVGDPFDISLDPVRMTEMAAGALIFLRGDVRAARQTIERTYSHEQVLESRNLPRSEQPYFTPGFPLALPLEHRVRIGSLDGPPAAKLETGPANPIVSDTGQLSWSTAGGKDGVVTVETERTEALIGFLKANHKALRNLSADLTTNFATLVLSSLDGRPLARASRMLLTAGSRVSNTGIQWNQAHTRVANQGGSPSLIEPVSGGATLRNIAKARGVSVTALDGSGKPIGEPIAAKETADGWSFTIGEPVTTWYVVTVQR
ncbi:MAG TPA: hypothetical protein VKV74_17955 [Bryobacteraceae bacterium]|nr:hypothetical protein [Bryobacteraceae bacterium]